MAQIFRKELKYVITYENYLQIQSLLEAVMERDEHCKQTSYMVRSQYYDSMTDADLMDNLDGVLLKRKIRVRIYDTGDEFAKLEYKCKNGSDGIKYSMSLTRKEVCRMENHQYDFLAERPEELAARLYTKMTSEVYRPKTIVEYQRMAYKFPASDVRITFDQNIRASINPYGIYGEQPAYVPLLHADKGVLEIKYNDFFPSALKPLLTKLDSVTEAYSKYSTARLAYL